MPESKGTSLTLPLISLRGVSLYPGTMMTFDVERKSSLEALRMAAGTDRVVYLAAQSDPSMDMPEENDLCSIGTVARVRQQISVNGGSLSRVMVEGLYRARTVEILHTGKALSAVVEPLPDKAEKVADTRLEALVRNAISLYEEYLNLTDSYTPEQVIGIISNSNPSCICDFIAHNVNLAAEDKQLLLEELRPSRRLELLGRLLNREIEVISIEKELSEQAGEAMNKSQREYYLREELKIIQQELGEDFGSDDLAEYREKISALPVSDEIRGKLLKELGHLGKQPFGSSEASVIRTYLDTCLEIPWGKKSKETDSLEKARKILDRDHYGLDKVKERIIEYLAVRRLSADVKGGLICLAGPPGCGKTSIAMSIASALNRKLVRISLGGVHDEAEIRGHRKTYIGSMPGRIINAVIQAGTCNPLIVLDEIDKLGNDYRGDPASALLETLDPEQNATFRDNFLEIPFDLSDTFFITTANTLDTIPRALLDRMEVIELSSYTDEEKLQIAKKHLIPKQRARHGLTARQLSIRDSAVREIITSYSKESGVRVLEREIAHICRKAAAAISEEKSVRFTVDEGNLESVIGPAKFKDSERRKKDEVGLVRGLAWTSVGGEILDAETAVLEGTGKIELTGNLGDVMKESAKAAVTCVRSRAARLGIDCEFYKNKDIHIHFPEGAVPKDGPSAGVTVTTAIVSALTGIPVRHDIAMTGEITLRGRVLAIGGLREKTMAALRSGITTVIIPKDNEPDLQEIDPLVRNQLKFIFAETIDDVLPNALVCMPGLEDKWHKSISTTQNSSCPQRKADSSYRTVCPK